jgi:ubiquinone/menaquinone biosynthesis C-methylase UbiE
VTGDWKNVYRDPAFAERYARKRASGASSRRREAAEAAAVERLLDRSGLAAGACALDCPSGTGRFTGLLSRRGLRVIAADIAAPMLERVSGDGGRVVADALRLPFASGSFELVLCVRLLHHVPDAFERRALLAELARTSSRFVLVSFFHSVSFHEVRDRVFAWFRPFRRTRHAITLRTLTREARACGLMVRGSSALFRYVKRQWFVLLERRNS